MDRKQLCSLLLVIATLRSIWFQAADAQSLTQLYNSKVVQAQRYQRPLASSAGGFLKYFANHCGVVVTLGNGQRWLVHKGNEYGKASETVVVSASTMTSAWSLIKTQSVSKSTVGDYVKAGGPKYSLVSDNCIHACNRMMDLR